MECKPVKGQSALPGTRAGENTVHVGRGPSHQLSGNGAIGRLIEPARIILAQRKPHKHADGAARDPQAFDHQVSRVASAYRGCASGRPNTFQYASQCEALYQWGTQYRPLRITRSRALHAANKAGRLSAAMTCSTNESMAGSDMTPTFSGALILAAREVKNVLSVSPGVLENPNRWTTISKSNAFTRLRYCTGSTTRTLASMPRIQRFLMKAL